MPGGGMVLSVRLSPKLSDEFCDITDALGIDNRSEIIRGLIEDWVKEQKNGIRHRCLPAVGVVGRDGAD